MRKSVLAIMFVSLCTVMALGGCVGAAHRPEGIKRFDAGEYSNALGWLEKEAAGGNVEAMVDLGHMAQYGAGMAKNEVAAEQLFEQAMAHGSVRAQTCLAVLYIQGSVIPHDEPKALELLQDAAAQGDDHADFDLFLIYTEGLGVTADKEQAKSWTDKAGHANDADVQRYIDIMRGQIYQSLTSLSAAALIGGYGDSAKVEFSIVDLHAVDAKIIRSSGHDDADAAILKAISMTSFSPPPVGIVQPKTYMVIIDVGSRK